MLPSNRFEARRGEPAGQFSIRINRPWRVCFEGIEGAPWNVEITDEH